MTQLAPAVVRAIRLVNFLVAHPAEVFTLSELCQRLDINRASALRVLGALVAAGYIERHPRHLTYTLGVTLVAVGQAAAVRHPAVRVAQAMVHLGRFTGIPLPLRDAASVLRRCLCSLEAAGSVQRRTLSACASPR